MKLKLTTEQIHKIVCSSELSDEVSLTEKQVKEIVDEYFNNKAPTYLRRSPSAKLVVESSAPVNHTDYPNSMECEHEWISEYSAKDGKPFEIIKSYCSKCGGIYKSKTKRMAPALCKDTSTQGKCWNLGISKKEYNSREEAMRDLGDQFVSFPATINGQPMWFDVPTEEE